MSPRVRHMVTVVWLAALAGGGVRDAAAGEPKENAMKLESRVLKPGETIDKEFTADGRDVSPPLAWQGAPAGTKQFALICDDPDAPTPTPWVHWVIYGIGPDVHELPEGVPPEAQLSRPLPARQGKNSWTTGRTIGYRGPAPPKGKPHHYHFRLFALDAALDLAAGLDKNAVSKAIAGHVLAEAELVGLYSR